MARIKKGVLGEISGRIGDKVYRVRDDKNFCYNRPTSQKISQSVKSVQNRLNFKYKVQLAKLIYSVPELYACWKSAKIPGRIGLQRIITLNSKKFSDSGLTVKNIISPPGLGIKISRDSITIEESNLIIRAFADIPIADLSFKLFVLVCVTNENVNERLILRSAHVTLQEGSALKGIISLNPDEMKKITICNKALLLFSFVSSSPGICWTSTVPFEFVTSNE
jgi:hypothetical protein